MNRDELYKFIQNSVLFGKVVGSEDIKKLKGIIPELAESILGSVEINKMYFKIGFNNRIILTHCTSDYESIDFGDAVDEIGPFAFVYNFNIREVSSQSITKIGYRAFTSSPIRSVKFQMLKEVEDSAFNNSSLEKLEAPELEIINKYAFVGCNALTEINAPKVKQVCMCAFVGCEKLQSVNFNSIEYIEGWAFPSSIPKFSTKMTKYMHPMAFSETYSLIPSIPIWLPKLRVIWYILKHIAGSIGLNSKTVVLIITLVIAILVGIYSKHMVLKTAYLIYSSILLIIDFFWFLSDEKGEKVGKVPK